MKKEQVWERQRQELVAQKEDTAVTKMEYGGGTPQSGTREGTQKRGHWWMDFESEAEGVR